MENCPFCDAPGSYREATDGSCYVCGMMLPSLSGKSEPEVATAVIEPVEEVVEAPSREVPTVNIEPSAAPTVFLQGSDPPAIELIHPRNLSPEYARRVTAAWQATRSPFKNPLETINSRTSTEGESDNLQIGTRSVGQGDEAGGADYKLSEVIGEGAMGTVWSAHQSSLNREVAIKMPKPGPGGTAFGRQLFISEVVVTGQLDHPNIVPIYDLARDETGQLFYAMKRVAGRSWDTCMHEEGRTRHDNIEILMKVCDAVRFAHDRHVIHRDIKPQNIMVGSYGEVSVMDWGIALRLPEGTHIPGMAKVSPSGTPAYMAPEMATGNANEIGYHTDVYLLGAVLYEIITGEPPHPAPSGTSDSMVQQKACLLIAARNVITPANETGEIVDIAYKAMATDISDRFATVDEFQSAIRDYFAHAESIALTDRGQSHLTNARELKNGVYEDYAKARFAFEEAIDLWPENSRARHGLSQATLDYAGSALERGDYALGLSLVDEDNKAHLDVAKKLLTAKRKSDRNRFVATASLVAAACFLVGGIAVSWFYANQKRDALVALEYQTGRLEVVEKKEAVAEQKLTNANRDIENTQLEFEKKKKELDEKSDTLAKQVKTQSDLLGETKKALTTSQTQIELQQGLAKEAQAKAERAQQTAQQASYRSEIGRAAQEIQRNDFRSASAILKQVEQKNNANLKLEGADQSKSAPARNWELRLLNYQASVPSAMPYPISGLPRIDTVAISPDRKWMAAGADDKNVYVWRSGSNKPAFQRKHDSPVSAITIAKDSKTLVTVAGKEVQFWTLPAGDSGGELSRAKESLRYSSPLLSVELSPIEPNVVLTSANDDSAQLWSRKNPDKPLRIFGHPLHQTSSDSQPIDLPVWQARFSPIGKQIATAGEDGIVRIWNTENSDYRTFDGHRGPVYAIEFSPDGKLLVSAGGDRRVLAWDVPPPSELLASSQAIEDRLKSAHNTSQNAGVHQLGEHDAAVHCLAFSRNGKTLFSGSDDNSLSVWDLSGGLSKVKLARSLRGHSRWVRSCAVAADEQAEQYVLSGSYDGQMFLWDWQKYDFPRVLSSESPTLTSAAASHDGRWIATAAKDGAVTLWDMTDPHISKPQSLTEGHDYQATTGVYFGDDSRLLTAGGDNSAVVWDAGSGVQLFRIGGRNEANGTGWRGVGAATRDGRLIATGSNDSSVLAKLWDAKSGRLVASLAFSKGGQDSDPESLDATALAFSPDNSATLFVGDQYGRCYLFNTSNGSLINSFPGHQSKVCAAGFLPDGRLLTASSDRSRPVALWTVPAKQATPQPERVFEHGDRVVAMAISDDGKTFVSATGSNDRDAVLRRWNVETGKYDQSITLAKLTEVLKPVGSPQKQPSEVRNAAVPGQFAKGSVPEAEKVMEVRSVALDPKLAGVLVTTYDPGTSTYQVSKWNLANAQAELQLIKPGLLDTSTAIYTPNHKDAFLTVGGRGARVRFVAQADQAVPSFRPQTPVQRPAALGGGIAPGVKSVCFSPNSHLVATAGADGSIKLWRLDNATNKWKEDANLKAGGDQVNSVAFHPTLDSLLVSASDDRTTRLWRKDANGWKDTTLPADKAGGGPVQQAIFTPPDANGVVDVLAAANAKAGGTVNRWSIDGKLLDTMSLDKPANCLAVSTDPDRKWLVVGVGNEARVWKRDALKGEPVIKLPGHSAQITALAFSTDGERLFMAGTDPRVGIWDTHSWQELLTLEQPTNSVVALAFMPSALDAKDPALLAAGADGQAILWPTVERH